jgi:hypothetical protein
MLLKLNFSLKDSKTCIRQGKAFRFRIMTQIRQTKQKAGCFTLSCSVQYIDLQNIIEASLTRFYSLNFLLIHIRMWD